MKRKAEIEMRKTMMPKKRMKRKTETMRKKRMETAKQLKRGKRGKSQTRPYTHCQLPG